MQKHTCKTYFSVNFEFDRQKNTEFIKRRCDCKPEEIGIFNKEQAEQYIKDNFDVIPEWRRHRFVIGCNENYDVDVNAMLRETLKNLFGKEDKIRDMQKLFGVTATLEIVPYIVAGSEEPNPYLSLDGDIIEFLYKSGTAMDLDYYVI